MELYPDQSERCPLCTWKEKTYLKSVLMPGTILRERFIVGTDRGQTLDGFIYIGWDQLFKRKVLIQECIQESMQEKDRFLMTGEMLLRLDGTPGLLDVFCVFPENERAYWILEYPGELTLKDMIRTRGILEFEDVQWMLREIAETLSITHCRGVYHGQLSSQYCYILPSGEVKLGGFTIRSGFENKPENQMKRDVEGLAKIAIYALTGAEIQINEYQNEVIEKLKKSCTKEAFEVLEKVLWKSEKEIPVNTKRFIDLFNGDATIQLTEK